jgi:excisionase family DNA binding protein
MAWQSNALLGHPLADCVAERGSVGHSDTASRKVLGHSPASRGQWQGRALVSARARREGNGRLLRAEEVANLLAVPKSWVYREVRADRLPHMRLGRHLRFAEPSIRAFIAGLERGPGHYRKYAPGLEPGGSPHE